MENNVEVGPMQENMQVHQKAGEALCLAQHLEISLTTAILMFFLLENGYCKDPPPGDWKKALDGHKTNGMPTIKIKKIDEKFRQEMALKRGQINLMIKNSSLGELKREFEKYVRVSPNGPSASFDVLQKALDNRNFLCHEFYKQVMVEEAGGGEPSRSIAKLEEIEVSIQEAIAFIRNVITSLRRAFPRTFAEHENTVH